MTTSRSYLSLPTERGGKLIQTQQRICSAGPRARHVYAHRELHCVLLLNALALVRYLEAGGVIDGFLQRGHLLGVLSLPAF